MSTTERERVVETPAVLNPKVERGAAIMDDLVPDWFTRINLADFDVTDGCKCVLAYTIGSYNGGTILLRKYGIHDPMDLEDHGFLDAFREGHTQDWRLAITARRHAA